MTKRVDPRGRHPERTPFLRFSSQAKALVIAAVVLLIALTGIDLMGSGPASQAPVAPSSTSTVTPTRPAKKTMIPAPRRGTALAAARDLVVKGRAPKTGYDRDRFGSGWTDTDHNSCSTREDVLRRDLRPVTVLAGTGGCDVIAGTLADPYTGHPVTFEKSPASQDVEIDHVVSLSDAWQKGAQQWSDAKRVTFANDPLELVATGGPGNAAKSDNDAASWLPSDKSYRCAFVARQITIKVGYGLWVTTAEQAAMLRVLARCPDQPTTSAKVANTPKSSLATVQQPEPDPSTSAKGQHTISYPNCAAVRAAGTDPIRRGDPGYSRQLDRDGDGIACE